jgi:hypothetical protein
MRRCLILLFLLTTGSVAAAAAPKFGPDALPVGRALDYPRSKPAPDFWMLSLFYEGERTPRGSSAAAAAMVVNAFRGVPEAADDSILSPTDLLSLVADRAWTAAVSENGSDVTFSDLKTYLRETMAATGLGGATIAAVSPPDGGQGALDDFRAALAVNERSAQDVMLVQFDRGVVTGSRPGMTVAPVGAYDAANDRVLVMDLDRNWFVPYWTSATTLLVAMTTPASVGPLAGKTGGYFLLTRP